MIKSCFTSINLWNIRNIGSRKLFFLVYFSFFCHFFRDISVLFSHLFARGCLDSLCACVCFFYHSKVLSWLNKIIKIIISVRSAMVCCGNVFVSRTFISGSKASIERTFQFAALEKNVVIIYYYYLLLLFLLFSSEKGFF